MSELPPKHVVAAVEEGQRLRGWIANGYAQIEFFLGDIIFRSLRLSEYQGVGEVLPHGSPDRIKRVRRILDIEGVFSEFKDELIEIIDEFEKHHETRNLLAHGFCEFHHTPSGDCGFFFRKWHRGPDRQDAQLQRTFRLVDLEYEKAVIVDLSDRALDVFFRIHKKLGLVGK